MIINMNVVSILLPYLLYDTQIWSKKRKLKKGDHIRVSRSFYYHHGIYISDDEVIHFSGKENDNILDWKNCEVIMTDLNTFLNDGQVEVKIYSKRDRQKLQGVDEIIRVAKSCIGQTGYNLLNNNCEHFANYCTLNKKISHQIDNLMYGKLQSIIIPSIAFILLAMNVKDFENKSKKIVKKRIKKSECVKENECIEKRLIDTKSSLYNYSYISNAEFENALN